jgi:hypothetical protein
MEPTMRGNSSKHVTIPVLQIYEGRIQAGLDEAVLTAVEETLNAPHDVKSDHLRGTWRHLSTRERKDTGVGIQDRHLQIEAGEVTLDAAESAFSALHNAIIELYNRRKVEIDPWPLYLI